MDEIIKLMHLAEEYDVLIEFNSYSMIIQRYGDIEGRTYNYNTSFLPSFVEEYGVKKCLDEFEDRLNKYIDYLKNKE